MPSTPRVRFVIADEGDARERVLQALRRELDEAPIVGERTPADATRATPADASVAAEHLPDGVLVFDQAHRLRYANATAREFLGDEPAQPLGDLTIPIAGGVSDLRVTGPDRVTRDLEVSRGDGLSGEVPVYVLTVRDVTDARAAEQAARTAFERFSLLVEHGSELTAVVGEDLRLSYFTQAARKILGLDPIDIVGRSLLERIHPKDRMGVRWTLEALLAGADIDNELVCRTGPVDGRWLHAAMTVTDLRHEPTVGGLVINAHDVTTRVELTERLTAQALYDPVTGLPNRRLLMDRLTNVMARRGLAEHPCAVLYLDLDGFKNFNDTHGHAVGDEILAAFARRLEDAVRPSDTVARLGGDEFVVLVAGLDSAEAAPAVAHRIIERCQEPLALDHLAVRATTSIGVAVADEDDEPGILLQRADAALYDAKRAGRNRVAVRGKRHYRRTGERSRAGVDQPADTDLSEAG